MCLIASTAWFLLRLSPHLAWIVLWRKQRHKPFGRPIKVRMWNFISTTDLFFNNPNLNGFHQPAAVLRFRSYTTSWFSSAPWICCQICGARYCCAQKKRATGVISFLRASGEVLRVLDISSEDCFLESRTPKSIERPSPPFLYRRPFASKAQIPRARTTHPGHSREHCIQVGEAWYCPLCHSVFVARDWEYHMLPNHNLDMSSKLM